MSSSQSRQLNICFVQPVQSPYWTLRLRTLAQHNDLAVTLLLERGSFAHRPGWEPEPIPGVDVEIVGSAVIASTSGGQDLGYKIHGIRSIPFRLVSALLHKRPDVVVVCNATQLFFAAIARWRIGCKVALIVEDTPHATRNYGLLARAIKAMLYRCADVWFAFSEDAKQFLAGIGIRRNVLHSSWSVDINSFKPIEQALERNDEIVEGSTARTMLFVGQLIQRKGVMQLLEGWRRIPAEFRRNSRLLLIGDGALKNEASAYIATHKLDGVQLLGQRPYAEVKTLMSRASVFVLPTLEDLFSLTVLEAMAAGCPIITTPYNGARELVTEGVNGWLVDPINPEELARVLTQALSPEMDLVEMGKRARQRVVSMDNHIVMANFADTLRKLVA